MAADDRACPSTPLSHASVLLGVVGTDGRVHYANPALPVDDGFRRAVGETGDAERRFRFAGRCLEGACQQWTGTQCGVIDSLLAQVDDDLGTQLRPCPIRRDCRWFAQRGADACRVCTWVVTDSTTT